MLLPAALKNMLHMCFTRHTCLAMFAYSPRLPCTLHIPCPCPAGVVRAEDARLLGDMAALRKQHRRLADLNRDMWGEHSKRAANQAELVEGLKGINLMIQQAAKLRVGPAQARVVAACRAAIKANNLQALSKVVCEGSAAARV
jgi:hypothetical protein